MRKSLHYSELARLGGLVADKTFTQEEKEKYKTSKFKPHHNNIIMSLQYLKLPKKQ